MKAIRKSNFELLRIISMLLIVAHHYAVHGGFHIEYGVTINNMIVDFLSIGGKLGVVLFIMITGYHMTNSKFDIKKIIKLDLQVIFYSVLFVLIFKLFGSSIVGNISMASIVKSFLPITFEQYWFVTAYVLLYVFASYINKLVSSINKEDYLKLLIIMFIAFTLIPTFTKSNLSVSNFVYFVYFYLIGSYIKLYYNKPKSNKYLWAFIVSYALIFISTIIFEYLGTDMEVFTKNIRHFSNINGLLVLSSAISLFIYFKDLDIKPSKIINTIGGTTFGIYLIHDNPNVRHFIWKHLFDNASYYHSAYLWLHALISITLVFVVSSVIELIRQFIMDKRFMDLVYKCYDKLEKNIINLYNRTH